jgi:hypothetical protein
MRPPPVVRLRLGKRTLVLPLAWWSLLFCLWLLFVAAAPPSEVWTGAMAALISAVAAVVAGQTLEVRFQPDPRWLATARSLPIRLVTDSAALLQLVGRRLARHAVHGRYLALPAPVKVASGRRAGAGPPAAKRRCVRLRVLAGGGSCPLRGDPGRAAALMAAKSIPVAHSTSPS